MNGGLIESVWNGASFMVGEMWWAILLCLGMGTINLVAHFLRYTSAHSFEMPVYQRKAIRFTGGILKAGTQDCYCSHCSNKYNMQDLQVKLDEFGFVDCSCGEELFRLIMVRVL